MRRPSNPLVMHLGRGSMPEGAPLITLCGKKRRRVSVRRRFVCGACVETMVEQVNAEQRENREQRLAYVDRLNRARRLALDAADAAFLGAEPLDPGIAMGTSALIRRAAESSRVSDPAVTYRAGAVS